MCIIGLVTLMNIHFILILPILHIQTSSETTMRSINFLINSFIPTIPIVTSNIILYKRIKNLLDSHSSNFGGNARNTTLQKAVFSTKIILSVSFVFVFCQILEWVQIVMVWVSLVTEDFRDCTCTNYYVLDIFFCRSSFAKWKIFSRISLFGEAF